MSRGRLTFVALSAALLVGVTAGGWMAAASREDAPGEDSFYRYLSVFSEVFSLVRQAYVDETDSAALLQAAMDGAVDALDPFAVFVPPAAASFEADEAAALAHSGLRILKEQGLPVVSAVAEGSPAQIAGIEVGDLVAQINSRPTRLLRLWEIYRTLAGPLGAEVKFELIRRADPIVKSIQLASFAAAKPALQLEDGVRVLRISWFDESTAAAVARLLETSQRQKAPNLLLDLRGSFGAAGEHGFAVARSLAAGELGSLMDRTGARETYRGAPPVWRGDVVVLVDRSTQGPAEVLATVLRQVAGARLVGENTFGYAGRSKLLPLPSGGGVRLTEAFFAGPDKKPLKQPLHPDVLVDERSRRLEEAEVPLRDLIHRRGIEDLLAASTRRLAA